MSNMKYVVKMIVLVHSSLKFFLFFQTDKFTSFSSSSFCNKFRFRLKEKEQPDSPEAMSTD